MASLLRCIVAFGLVAGALGSAAAQSPTQSATPCCDDDFGGNFGLSILLALVGGFLVFAILLLSLVEVVAPDPEPEGESGDG